MNKYDKDMEGIDLKIQIKRSDYETTLENRIKLEETVSFKIILICLLLRSRSYKMEGTCTIEVDATLILEI